jgi:hypothetical protein
MALTLAHTFVSAKADGADSTLVQPSHWNAQHALNMSSGFLVGRGAAGSGAAQEVSLSTNFSLTTGNAFDLSSAVALPGTGAITLPKGTTAQQPAGTTSGRLRYNTSLNALEFHNGTAWLPLASSSTALLAANNLSDLANVTTAQTNLALIKMSAAEYRVGTADRVVTVDKVWLSAAQVTITYAASQVLDFSSFINGKITLTGNIAFGAPTNTKAGQMGMIEIVQDSTVARTVTWDAAFKFPNGTDPSLTTTLGGSDFLAYYCPVAGALVCNLLSAVA